MGPRRRATRPSGVCIFSYNDQIRVGFKTDTNVVPDIANLVAAYAAEMEELLALAAGRVATAPDQRATV